MGPRPDVTLKTVSVLVPPSADLERGWAARNGMTPEQFRKCVLMHYYFLVTRFVDRAADVVVLADEAGTMRPLIRRLENQGYHCVRAKKAVCAAVCTRLYACCSGRAPPSCAVYAKVGVADVLAPPAIEFLPAPPPPCTWCI